MATYTRQQIAAEIKTHIDSEGSGYRNWYVGISGDPRTRLTEHGLQVDPKTEWYIWRCAQTAQEARDVELYLIKLGFDGGGGGGDNQSTCVYAYKKTWRTTP